MRAAATLLELAEAVGEALGAAEGLALLDGLDGAQAYQPYWAVRDWLAARYRIA